MDMTTGVAITKAANNLTQNKNILNKSAELLGMLFPYAGLEKTAVQNYIADIEKSDRSPEAKAFAILNTRKTFKKLKNQKSIADIAIENADEKTDFSDKSGVSEDWLDRFMDSAGFVSPKELQLVWGKILANEFKRPGTTPPNMIRVLSEITPEMATAFRCICGMSILIIPLKADGNIEKTFKNLFVPYRNNDEIFHNLGVSFNILNELETLGVLKFAPSGTFVFKGIKNTRVIISIGNRLEVIEDNKENSIPIGNVILTSVGEALQNITDCNVIDGYYDMVKKHMLAEGVKFAKEHEFITVMEGDTLKIVRKN